MRLALATIAAICCLTHTAISKETCPGPTSGEFKNEEYNFSYESWMKKTDDGSMFRFGRCVFNKNSDQQLRVYWKDVGIKGYVIPDDSAYIFFNEKKDDNHTDTKPLWYGKKPDHLDPKVILRPNEGQNLFPGMEGVWLAQSNTAPSLEEMLTSPDIFAEATARRKGGPVLISSGARISIPTREAEGKQKESGYVYQEGDFIPYNIQFVHVLGLSSGSSNSIFRNELESSLELRIEPDLAEYTRAIALERHLPSINISVGDSTLADRLFDGKKEITFDGTSIKYVSKGEGVKFPVQLIQSLVHFESSSEEAGLDLPVTFVTGNKR